MAGVNRDPRAAWVRSAVKRAGFESVEAFDREFALKPYRWSQMYRAAVKELQGGPQDVTTLPKGLRDALTRAGLTFSSVEPIVLNRSSDGQTTKGLFRLRDGNEVEAVLMEHHGGRNTVCISSQAGCAFACAFCSTGQAGFTRNLDAAQIFDQARFFARELAERGKRVTNVVFMGMGEPMMNWSAVDTALTILNSPQGLGIGARHITVSTVGVLPGIVSLSERPEQFRLAISIHAPSDELRRELMPVNVKYPLADVIAQAKTFGRRVTFEYVMLGGVNDAPEHARQLATLARSCRAFVNLIPLHEGGALEFKGSPPEGISGFARVLRDAGVEVAIRKSRGKDIAAACGQLRVERLGRGAPRRPNEHGQVNVA